MRMLALVFSLSTVLFSVGAQAGVQVGDRLGAVHLNDAKDRDVIVLPACKVSKNSKARKISFTVDKFPAEIDKLKVVFQNGEQQELVVKDHFRANSRSRWMNLNGDARCISKIVVKGDTDTPLPRPNRRAKITFYGI
jgi:hypothetical protein